MITSLSVNRGGLGRFANQCFTIAGTIGIAIKNNRPFAFPEWINRDNALFGGNPDNITNELVNPLPLLPEGLQFGEYGYFWGYRDVRVPYGNWNIDSHLQSERFFSHCIDLVRHYLTFKNEPEPNDYVAVHYRAGDYIDDPNAYHPRQPKEYYEEAMKLFPGRKFLIFTDDKDAAAERIPGHEIISGHYLDDFKLMKSCHSFITANSSYSLMAAILADQTGKQIVCPRRWFGPSVGLETSDIYPQQSIVL